MSAHTPGPWTAKPDRMLCSTPITSRDGVLAVTAGTGNKQTHEANARLIAAAPDLLVALKAMIEATPHSEIPGMEGSPLYQAREAIAKAVA